MKCNSIKRSAEDSGWEGTSVGKVRTDSNG